MTGSWWSAVLTAFPEVHLAALTWWLIITYCNSTSKEIQWPLLASMGTRCACEVYPSMQIKHPYTYILDKYVNTAGSHNIVYPLDNALCLYNVAW